MIKVNLKQVTEKFRVIGQPLIFTIILMAAAVTNGYASASAFILPPDNGLQSARFCDLTDAGCGLLAKGFLAMDTGSTADSLPGQRLLGSFPGPTDTLSGNGGQIDGDLATSGPDGAPPAPTPEPMSSVLIGAGLVGIGSLTRRKRRVNE